METKFTTDGRKVVVIGKLNAQETIVQEIFYIGGSEIPSGEHFVTKSLHDAPAKSWKVTEEEHLEARLTAAKKNVEDAEARSTRALEVLTSKINMLESVAKKINPEVFEMARDVLTGQMKWVVIGGYNPKLVAFEEFEKHMEARYDRTFEGFRLLSLYGKYTRYSSDDGPKGDLNWRLSHYSDGSGSSTEVFLFKEKPEAVEKITSLIESKKGYNEDDISVLLSLGVSLNKEKLEVFEDNRLKSAKDAVERAEAALKKAVQELSSVENRPSGQEKEAQQ